MGGLAHHHGVDVEGAQVSRPDHLLQQLGEQRRGDGGDPLLVAETLAQLAHLHAQAIAVVRLAAPYVAFILQRFQQAPHRGPVQAGELGQTRRAGPAVEAIQGVEQQQAARQATYGLVFGIALGGHRITFKTIQNQ
ncbi:hypothetical protein D3C81_1656290 [compost metagenome]